jgi:hypothetical protein
MRNAQRKQTAEVVKYLPRESALKEKKSLTVERELDRIYKEDGGVTPVAILERAARTEHPLHQHFEWDDTIAGQKYRLHQATQMILASKFVCLLKRDEMNTPQVVSAMPERLVRRLLPEHRGGKFIMRNELTNDETKRAQFVIRKRAELRTWCNSVCDIEELRHISETIETWLGQ